MAQNERAWANRAGFRVHVSIHQGSSHFGLDHHLLVGPPAFGAFQNGPGGWNPPRKSEAGRSSREVEGLRSARVGAAEVCGGETCFLLLPRGQIHKRFRGILCAACLSWSRSRPKQPTRHRRPSVRAHSRTNPPTQPGAERPAGTLIFRRSYLEASSELGFNCVAEAGARIRAGTLLLPCQEGRVPRDRRDWRDRRDRRDRSPGVGVPD